MKTKKISKSLTLALSLMLGSNLSLAASSWENTVLGIQKFLDDSNTLGFTNPLGRKLNARLVNLNPSIGSWYVLDLRGSDDIGGIYHLESSDPLNSSIRLTQSGLEIISNAPSGSGNKATTNCDIFNPEDTNYIKVKADIKAPFVELCGGKIFIRKQSSGSEGGLKELGANLLRENLGETGEGIVNLYKSLQNVTGDGGELGSRDKTENAGDNLPAEGKTDPSFNEASIKVSNMDLNLKNKSDNNVNPGSWYPLAYQEGMAFSAYLPKMVDSQTLSTYKDRVKSFDGTEDNALVYLVSFDLSKFEMGWSHGTNLPGVGWSTRSSTGKDASEAGPDGFDSLRPLAQSGILNPVYRPRLAATMCGGFQRHHAVFKAGDLNGKYYGFMQEGVVLSKLNNGMSTLIMYKNGDVDIKNWTDADTANLANIRYARQNGAALIEPDSSGKGIPGKFVGNWMLGNWSGSVDAKLRSQRAGACIASNNGHKYLIFGYFSAATPSAMARVFQAYQCESAIHLDMNSAAQGYLGLFSNNGKDYFTEHPVKEMASVDTTLVIDNKKVEAPRYVGTPATADFFFILRKDNKQ
jgi:hypothetical protein